MEKIELITPNTAEKGVELTGFNTSPFRRDIKMMNFPSIKIASNQGVDSFKNKRKNL